MSRAPANHFLRGLSAENRAQVARHLNSVELRAGESLYTIGDQIEHVYFLRSGIVSLTIAFSDGRMGDVGLAGVNTIVGGIAALRDPEALNTAMVQADGFADRIATGMLAKAVAESSTLRDVVRTHEQALSAQTYQIAACNAVHTLAERLSRWLLQCRDLLNTNRMPLTHELLAMMLGVRRPSLSLIVGELQQAGLVKSHRGQIEILDVNGLRGASCECYDVIVSQVRRLTGWSADDEFRS